MVLSRRWSAFLVAVGVWTWLIWPRFGLAIWKDDRSFAGGDPTSFLWVHALLIGASLVIGTTVGVLGVRAWRLAAPGPRKAEESAAVGGAVPKE
ncbi:SCO4848 family membrane protein [Actinoplanes sp. NPDC026623]|uniref:SCO4848 family membrane protein n=1 Tax=Actinoplanes sp. NPDC026623 TaxID=3155610 RepID=UPI0033DD6502